MLSVENLTVKIRGKEIIKQIAFLAEKSENISIIGANGAGKTTLLRSIAALNDFSGSIKIGSSEIRAMKPAIRASYVSFIPQGAEITGDFTVKQFVELSRFSYRKPWERPTSEDRSLIQNGVDLTQTGDFLNRRLSTLSGGEKQRVLLAGAIAQNSSILLLDEPFAFLDPVQREKISKTVSEIAAQNKLVVTVTHEINEAFLFSTRILAISEGRVVFDGIPRDFIEKKVAETLFNAKFVKIKHPEREKILLFPA